MKKLQTKSILFLVVGVCWMTSTWAADNDGQSDTETEAQNLIGNLQLSVPSLANTELRLEALQPTKVAGLRAGTFQARGMGKIHFLLAGDEQLYLLANEPIDLLPSQQLGEALSERETLRQGAVDKKRNKLMSVAETSPTRGQSDAPITILGFVDYECSYCSETNEEISQLVQAYPGQVRYAAVDFPREGAANWARKASMSALCAAQQNDAAYWVLHDYYLENQAQLSADLVLPESRKQLSKTTIDPDQWQACVTNQTSVAYSLAARKINAATILSISLGIKGTPALYVNGEKFEGVPSLETLEAAIANVAPANSPELTAALDQRKATRAKELAEHQATLQAAVEMAPRRGNADAEITIVEFSDFQCPYCADAAESMKELLAEHGDNVSYAVFDYPLDNMHPWARNASIAAACGAAQSDAAYWTLHDYYFENQAAVTEATLLLESRQQLADHGIDLEAWAECASDTASENHLAAAAKVQRAADLGKALGVIGTPTFFINGKYVPGAPSAETIEALVNAAKRGNPAQVATP